MKTDGYVNVGKVDLKVGWNHLDGKVLIGVKETGETEMAAIYPMEPDAARGFAKAILAELKRRGQ